MKRLFTFGCSYTKYMWPTWADLLLYDFDYGENWGKKGIGCRAIAERVAECHARNNFTSEDTIVIQWSTHLRNDFYLVKSPLKRPNGWQTYGSIISLINKEIYDKKWFDNFFYEPAYIMHCLNHMLLTQGLLKSTGCKWYMTSIGDWDKVSTDLNNGASLGETWLTEELSIWDNEDKNSLKIYKKIWDNNIDNWITPIEIFLKHDNQKRYVFFDNVEKRSYKDPHPTVRQYASWLDKELKPKLHLQKNEKSENWINEIEKIYLDNKHDVHSLNNEFSNYNYRYSPECFIVKDFGF